LAIRLFVLISHFIEVELIIIYDESIWIWNSGVLPEGLSIEQLKKPHAPVRRNPLIIDIFFRAGYIEQFGSGTLRMINAMKEEGHPEPKFEEQGERFITILYGSEPTQKNDVVQLLNKRQKTALEYVRANESIDNPPAGGRALKGT
jgi:ATP-dependent DNA helicase RecG